MRCLIILYGPINDFTDNENFKLIPERVEDTALEDIWGKTSRGVEGPKAVWSRLECRGPKGRG